ncbi:MAG: hypothetical protein JO144_10420 [Actinobacteria bacterium]|nr:hypothetical protein [Actinomycetota bacterium]
MSIVETTLIFVGIPAAAIVLVAAAVYGRAAVRTPRYRPGSPWQFEPVWYLPHPEHQAAAGSGTGSHAAALPAGGSDGRALPGQVAETVTASGGASGEW